MTVVQEYVQRADLNAFGRFVMLQQESLDTDPVYPVMRARLNADGIYGEDRLWYILLYVAYYNLASAEAVYSTHGPFVWPQREYATLPTGIERRGLRGGAPLVAHLKSIYELAQQYGSLLNWLDDGFIGDPAADYRQLRDINLRLPWGNGRWAAYKTAELLEEVAGFQVRATDMGNEGSTGPLHGLQELFPGMGELSVPQLDALGEALLERLGHATLIRTDIDELETHLCNWHSLVRGGYYSGHDTDELMDQIAANSYRLGMSTLWNARRAALPNWTLGELNGWKGVDHERNKAFKKAGVVLRRDEPWPAV